MRLEDGGELPAVHAAKHLTHNAILEAYKCRARTELVALRGLVHLVEHKQRCARRAEQSRRRHLIVMVVQRGDGAIAGDACGNVRALEALHAVDGPAREAYCAHRLRVGERHLDNGARLARDEPEVLLSGNALALHALAEVNLLHGFEVHERDSAVHVRLRAIERRVVPDAQVPVDTTRDDAPRPFSVVEEDFLDHAAVAALARAAAHHALDQAAVPDEQVALLRAAEHLAVVELEIPGDVAQLHRAELANLALQLESGEG